MKKNRFFGIVFFSLIALLNINAEAALQPELSQKAMILEKNENVVLKVENSDKKVRWFSNSKKVSLKESGQEVKIKALRPGKALITARVGKTVLKCNVKVSKVPFQERSPKGCIYSSVTKNVSWGKVPGAEGYLVYGKQKNGTYKVIKKVRDGSTLYANDRSNKKNASRFYKVRAYRRVNGKIVYSKAATQKYILE